jgi:hypothetical protein
MPHIATAVMSLWLMQHFPHSSDAVLLTSLGLPVTSIRRHVVYIGEYRGRNDETVGRCLTVCKLHVSLQRKSGNSENNKSVDFFFLAWNPPQMGRPLENMLASSQSYAAYFRVSRFELAWCQVFM